MTDKTRAAPAQEKKPDKSLPRIQAALSPAGPDTAQAAGFSAAGNLAIQNLLRNGIVQASLSISQPGDPLEQEADAQAHSFTVGQVAAPKIQARNRDDAISPPTGSGGFSLPAGTRNRMEAHFGRDFSGVRVHTDQSASRSAEALSANAYTFGRDIVFRQGQYAPDTARGQALLAHELTHTLQQGGESRSIQRNGNGAPLPPTAAADTAATTVVTAVRADDVGAAVPPLRDRSQGELASIRQMVFNQTGYWLEHWLISHMNRANTRNTVGQGLIALATALPVLGAGVGMASALAGPGRSDPATNGTAEEGLRRLWPVVPLIDKLELYDEGYREIEQAQLDTIRSASAEERAAAARETTRLTAIYSTMNAREEYDARNLIDASAEANYATAMRMLNRRDEETLFDAILALAPTQRRQFINDQYVNLFDLLPNWQLTIVRSMMEGGEAQALIARLRLATEGRLDDMTAVQAVVDRAVALLRERRELQASLNAPGLPAAERTNVESRLQELNDLDTLLQFQRGRNGDLVENSFMGLLAGARGDSSAFGADVSRLAEFAPEGAGRRDYLFQVAKQRILMAGSDLQEVQTILMTLHAPPVARPAGTGAAQQASSQYEADVQFRNEVMADPAVSAVIHSFTGFQQDLINMARTADEFGEVTAQLNAALNTANDGEFFRLVLRIARNDSWRVRFQNTAGDPFDVYARTHGRRREIMETILRTQHMPLADVLGYSGDVDFLRNALKELPEADRTRLRQGWSLIHNRPVGPLTADQDAALHAYQDFEARVRTSQTTWGIFDPAGFESVLRAALGTEPTADELSSGAGRYNAALFMHERVAARQALRRGVATRFTESDETMDAAGREFEALWMRLQDSHSLTMIDFAGLSALYQRFEGRAEEFTQANDAIGEMAGMIAATVAGIVVVAATGGAATPGVVALAAATGAGTRVVTREMFGDQYYNAMSNQGVRDALIGAVDAALAVVSGRLAARGVELLGLGGHALTSQAARMAGEVVEEATRPLTTKIAAGAVESALDGAFSGAVSEGFGAFTDERTWRRGIMDGLVRVGQAAIVGGLTGLATGGVMGAAMPVLGRGTRWLWNAVVGQSIENTLERVGARETLNAARAAARSGNVDEVNRLAAELETHLSPEEGAALRDQLNSDLRQALGHPPGTAQPASDAQARLLAESGALEEGLRNELLDAEEDIVRRSHPQPSTEPGYIDEVDLGNGHTWRRTEEGTWCRFSRPTICGTVIRNGPAMSPTARAEAEAALLDIQRLVEQAADARRVSEQYPSIYAKLSRERIPGQRTINLSVLSPQERQVLEEIFTRESDPELEQLTLADVRDAMGRPAQESERLYQLQDAAIGRLRESTRPLYDKVRAASPTDRVRDRIIGRARGLDQISGMAPPSGALAADHVVPVREIVNMRGFAELDWVDQVGVANYEPNLMAVDRSANSSRADWSWAEWPDRSRYSADAMRRMEAAEIRLRAELQAEIDRRLTASGRTVRQ
ncbi:MAG TPA: DUF4157 domain-containing protein [Anaerolineales bacterium]|nr:DUF4157 domain-containing protein [Anaerolineales bacterium]